MQAHGVIISDVVQGWEDIEGQVSVKLINRQTELNDRVVRLSHD